MNKSIIYLMWFAELPFLSLQAQSPGGVARAAENNSTTAGNQSMRVVTFKAVPGTARTYYYHRDHLGSTTLITNKSGEVVQRVEYLPTGETFIEQQDTSWVSPHKFNGKELDEETGLYYYGTRYYEPRYSLWLGTDPMQGQYPGVSTYAYCMGNPVNAVDVDGKKSYLIIWTSDAYHYGHAAFAIDNYKYDSQSKKMVPDGTLTSYSLFPIGIYSITQTIRDEKVRGLFLVSRNVSLDAIRNNEYNSGEDYKPDGIIEINSDYILDTEEKRHMESEIQSHKGYRGRSRNCSTFAREGVKKATGKDVNGEERSLLIFNYVTPNKLFQDTKKMQNTNVLKDPGGKENNTFVPF
jgi:RHS repeat-associated protein